MKRPRVSSSSSDSPRRASPRERRQADARRECSAVCGAAGRGAVRARVNRRLAAAVATTTLLLLHSKVGIVPGCGAPTNERQRQRRRVCTTIAVSLREQGARLVRARRPAQLILGTGIDDGVAHQATGRNVRQQRRRFVGGRHVDAYPLVPARVRRGERALGRSALLDAQRDNSAVQRSRRQGNRKTQRSARSPAKRDSQRAQRRLEVDDAVFAHHLSRQPRLRWVARPAASEARHRPRVAGSFAGPAPATRTRRPRRPRPRDTRRISARTAASDSALWASSARAASTRRRPFAFWLAFLARNNALWFEMS